MDLKKIKSDNKRLSQEIKELKRILRIVKIWMEKEVKWNVIRIVKNRLLNLTRETKKDFLNDNIEDIISKKISDFFGEILILNIPKAVFNNIISAEINYYNLKKNPISDWLSVVSSYHKALDVLVENLLTKWFRKFANKKWYNILRQNKPIEKSLNSVVTKWYILSIWRLFHIIKLIKNEEKYFDYVKAFREYLNKYKYLKDVLFDEKFYHNLGKLVESEILWKKRHSWKITFDETKMARKLFIWWFKYQNCIIYKLIKTQHIDY